MQMETLRKRRVVQWIVVAFGAAVLMGCQTLGSPVGRTLADEAGIALQETGVRPGTWSTRDLTVTYDSKISGNTLDLAGRVFFAGPIRNNFTYLDYFQLAVIFADDSGRILEMHGLVSAARSGFDYPLAFQRTFVLPQGAGYFGFSYTGRAIEGGSVDGGGWSNFFYYPVR